jgi:ubiquinone biosynthesis monooxygenase Coq7
MRRLPGDPTPQDDIQAMIRVDHAGEYGALRIYAGQKAFLRKGSARRLVEHMAAQERHHLDTFDTIMKERHVRPTALMPLWHLGGYALGAATAMLGEKAAFACTVAVESVIEEHYASQEGRLAGRDDGLAKTIATFRADEREHHDTSLTQGAEETPFYEALSTSIKAISKTAIWLSTRF